MRLDNWWEKIETVLLSVYVLELRPKICARDTNNFPLRIQSYWIPRCQIEYLSRHGSSHCAQLSHIVTHRQCLLEPTAGQLYVTRPLKGKFKKSKFVTYRQCIIWTESSTVRSKEQTYVLQKKKWWSLVSVRIRISLRILLQVINL